MRHRTSPGHPLPVVPIAVGSIFLAIVLSFWFPDLFYYPFRVSGPGPEGVYGTWTGIVHTAPSERRGTPMTFASQEDARGNSNAALGPSLAVVRVTLRPPVFSTVPEFFWRSSHELAGAVDVYLPDGTHQHCTHRLGGFPEPGQLQLLIYDSGKDMDAIAEAKIDSAGLQFSSGMCPVRSGVSVGWAGLLTKGRAEDVSALVARLPTAMADEHARLRVREANFAREWSGVVKVYEPAPVPGDGPPNASMRMRVTASPDKAGRFTAHGAVQMANGLRWAFTMPSVTLEGERFEAAGTFRDTRDDQSVYNRDGSLRGTVSGDCMTITQGGVMILSLTGELHATK